MLGLFTLVDVKVDGYESGESSECISFIGKPTSDSSCLSYSKPFEVSFKTMRGEMTADRFNDFKGKN